MASSLYETAPIAESSSHVVMFRLPVSSKGPPKPNPSKYTDSCSRPSVDMPNGERNKETWDLICERYKKPIHNFEELRQAILSYNDYDGRDGNFNGLKEFLEKKLSKERQRKFFEELLPKIIRLALSLPEEVTQPVPLLQKQSTLSISLSQKQIGVLLANAFLCTFPSRSGTGEKCGHGDYPDINFNRLFLRKEQHMHHKFECIFNYFQRITTEEPDGVVTFTRHSFSTFPDFSSSTKPLPRLKLEIDGGIEKADNHLQISFADKYIGGMILTKGSLQEEVRFLLCPELIITRLFTAVLQDNEALISTGFEQYNYIKGYNRKIQFISSFTDKTPRDEFKRRNCHLVSLDAINFSRRQYQQYSPENMLREMQKAYSGFCPRKDTKGTLLPIATGNWGCGVFRGDAKLKSLLQLIAAGEAGREVTYFAFGNERLVSSLGPMYNYLIEKNVTIGQLISILLTYDEKRIEADELDLYGYIRQQVDEKIQ